jgi:hypothetical protein
MRVPQPRKRFRLATGRAGSKVRRPSVRRSGVWFGGSVRRRGPTRRSAVAGSGSGAVRRGSGLSLAAPSPPIRVGVTALRLRRPNTGRAWLPALSPRFATVRAHGLLRPRVPVPWVACRTEPPLRARNRVGSKRRRGVSFRLRPLRMSRDGLPDALFSVHPEIAGRRPRSPPTHAAAPPRRELHPIPRIYIKID